MMGISFFSTRIVLEHLGVNDFGIYNVVGGMVSMFALISAALTSAITRFLTYEIGNGNKESINETFSASVSILLLLVLGFVIIMEPCGIWFLNNKMQIAPERLNAAHWVLQCSIVTFGINLISIPYNALIIANEKMQAFAYISLLEAVLKLAVAYTLLIPVFDSLKMYAVFIMVVAIVIRFTYGRYAAVKFKSVKLRLGINKGKFKELLSFTGWTCIGGSASILNSQGVNILLNIFCGTAINAARGVAVQVTTAVSSFSGNFMMAVNPQIIKTYASGDKERNMSLVFQSARFSFLLMLLLSVPIFIQTEPILNLWLTDVPTDTSTFIRIVLLQMLVETMCLPLQTLNQASGKVKLYQIVAGGALLLNFPFSYLFLKLGYQPVSVFYVALGVSIIALLCRVITLKYLIGFRAWKYMSAVFVKGAFLCGVSIIGGEIITIYLPDSTIGNWISLVCSTMWTLIVIYSIGINSSERKLFNGKIRTIIKKFI